MTFYCKKLTATTVLVNVRQLGDGFENRRTNFSGRAWATRGVANLAGSGHNRGSTKFSTPRPSLARRRPHHGFLMGTLGSSHAKKCHTYSAPHSSRADILKDGDVKVIQDLHRDIHVEDVAKMLVIVAPITGSDVTYVHCGGTNPAQR